MMLTGCTQNTAGRPVATPPDGQEPAFPTPRPPRTTPPSPTPSPTPGPEPTRPPGGGEVLQPQNGYVFIETKSGQTRCQINEQEVGCESAFTDSPEIEGIPANGVRYTANGQLAWVLGNIGDIPAVTLDYRTYSAAGWTIDARADGTTFTNDRTGRGIMVRVEGVETF
ncbi:hypothetical protein [Mycobacterium sp. SMC-4]|uniref:hypothetical protein n=1 Tax=Mycobacterium sp. SMC-4 TaxID=2857059 RepID=UPI0021B3ED65|nr:hypothetical protein [Mycobacterium sp. SMC-4]UXA20500.1 hypothetical protein KXD98_01865 [Mycobacterium sp. SMC-4]